MISIEKLKNNMNIVKNFLKEFDKNGNVVICFEEIEQAINQDLINNKNAQKIYVESDQELLRKHHPSMNLGKNWYEPNY